MPRQLSLNFNGAPPSSGGGTDKIPPGDYELVVTKTSDPGNRSQSGKPMVVLSYKVFSGPMKNKRLRDNFVLPASADDQKVGLMRLHAALLSMGMRVPGDRGFKLDLDSLINRRFRAVVVDAVLPARGDNPAREVSSVDEYKLRPTAVQPDEDEDDDEGDGDGDDEGEDEDDGPVEPEPPARPANRTASNTNRNGAAAPSRQPVAAAASGRRQATGGNAGRRQAREAEPEEEDDDGTDFPFDDDDDN